MHKVSEPYKEKHRPKVWFLRWFVNGQKYTKSFQTVGEAKAFRQAKYIELNSDVYQCIKSEVQFEIAKEKYLEKYDSLAKKSKIEAVRVVNYFAELIRPFRCKDITQESIDNFIRARSRDDVSKWTVNKDIGVLKAFMNWLISREYYPNRKLIFDFVKTPALIKTALTDEEIIKLLKSCPTEIWKMRILLSLCTGLRAGDIDRLNVESINLKLATLSYIARKTNKGSNCTPLPDALIPVLKKYLNGRSTGKLFPDNNIRKTWESIRTKAGLDCTRQDFRVTFSTLIQQYSGIETAKELLQHSSKRVTQQHYSDTTLLMRIRVNRLPAKRWMKGLV